MISTIKAKKPIKPWQTKLALLKQPKVYIPAFIGLIIVAVLGSIASQYYLASKKEAAAKTPAAQPGIAVTGESTKTAISPLDGLRYSESAAQRPVLGVMIENHPDSRPQFGLSQASIVYEAQAEGGITRFLAIFGPNLPAKVGPVRSARTYYLDWCIEYDCFYAHVGGNIDALDLIPKLGIKDLDQFRYGTKAFYRVPKKGIALEHTMFADPAKLYTIAADNQWSTTGTFPSVDFKNDASPNERPANQQIDIEISSAQFNPSWTYNANSNSYSRAMVGTPHIDSNTNKTIESKVIIVQEVASRPTVTRINEKRLIMDTVGSGKAKIFQDGKAIEGTWSKNKQKERTIFLDANGQEIKYNAGQRWITVVNPGSKVTVTP